MEKKAFIIQICLCSLLLIFSVVTFAFTLNFCLPIIQRYIETTNSSLEYLSYIKKSITIHTIYWASSGIATLILIVQLIYQITIFKRCSTLNKNQQITIFSFLSFTSILFLAIFIAASYYTAFTSDIFKGVSDKTFINNELKATYLSIAIAGLSLIIVVFTALSFIVSSTQKGKKLLEQLQIKKSSNNKSKKLSNTERLIKLESNIKELQAELEELKKD